MLTPDEVKEQLKDRRLLVVAQATKVSYNTIARMAKGENVSAKSLLKVSDYLEGK